MLAAIRTTGLGVLGAIGLICVATQVYAEEHSHKPAAHKTGQSLNQGAKLETDEVLRHGMENIRQLMASKQEAIAQDQLRTQDYQLLAEAVGKNISHIVKNCKLPKKSDAAFHSIVLADMTQSNDIMRASPKYQAQRAAALGVLQSLRNYGEYFQHPGWQLNNVQPR